MFLGDPLTFPLNEIIGGTFGETLTISFYALFVSVIIFSKKWVIFQKIFSIKLSHSLMFGSNFKWVEKQSFNFSYLAYYEIELFSKKN